MKTHVFRLRRGDDLLESIRAYAAAHALPAAVVISGVGCVRRARLRCADGVTAHDIGEGMEIVSLTGTVSAARTHLHAAFARRDLSTLGGHLLPGCIVNTTAEIVLAELPGVRFGGELDAETGYQELTVTQTGANA